MCVYVNVCEYVYVWHANDNGPHGSIHSTRLTGGGSVLRRQPRRLIGRTGRPYPSDDDAVCVCTCACACVCVRDGRGTGTWRCRSGGGGAAAACSTYEKKANNNETIAEAADSQCARRLHTRVVAVLHTVRVKLFYILFRAVVLNTTNYNALRTRFQ